MMMMMIYGEANKSISTVWHVDEGAARSNYISHGNREDNPNCSDMNINYIH